MLMICVLALSFKLSDKDDAVVIPFGNGHSFSLCGNTYPSNPLLMATLLLPEKIKTSLNLTYCVPLFFIFNING